MEKSEILKELERAVKEYEIDLAENLVKEAIKNNINPIECFDTLINSITKIGQAFNKGELFLPDLIAASDVVKKAMPVILKEIESRGEKTKSIGKVVIGTVAGDIHNIGKDMVATLLFASGFEVIDLGIDVGSENFINAIKEHKPDILAMSALLTTTVYEMKKTIETLKEEDIREKIKIIIGGAPVNQEFADSIGADGYGATATEGVEISKKWLGVKS